MLTFIFTKKFTKKTGPHAGCRLSGQKNHDFTKIIHKIKHSYKKILESIDIGECENDGV
jgi:hypothetical protein